MSNDIKISIGGKLFTGWKTAKVTTSLETLSGHFDLSVVDEKLQKENADWLLRPQDECIIFIGNDKLITGYIDTVTNNITSDSHEIRISGRDKTGDIVDCNFINTPNSWNKINIYDLAKNLCAPFNVSVVNGGISLTDTFKFTVNKSNTVFENLNKKVRDLGMLLITNENGELVLTNSGSEKITEVLEFGSNIKKGNVSHTYVNRFSNYVIESQLSSSKGWSKNTISVKTETEDEGIKRYRPKLFKMSRPISKNIAQKTVQWESSVRAAMSQSFNITVQGFRQSNDDLWKINRLVDVYAPPLYINPTTELLISSVTFNLTENGSFTNLVLKRKDAYTAKPTIPQAIKANGKIGWDALAAQKSGGSAKDTFKDIGKTVKEAIT